MPKTDNRKPKTLEKAIIEPAPEPWEAPVSPRVIMTFARPDYHFLSRQTQAGAPRYIWDCALREGRWQGRPLTITAPAVGAPYAVMVLEKLIALGARLVLALGWCGSLQPQVKVGHLALPTGALAGDGTSRHYDPTAPAPAPDPGLFNLLRQNLSQAPVPWHSGMVWTTDAFYRETVELVRHYQVLGALGVDLELAALFAAGAFRGIAVAGLLVVSDELADLTWKPGYRSARFRQARDLAVRLALDTAAQWENSNV
ncbi:MAG: uridine phosphorylase [Deltaproteobacteria bacterium]|nr:uridine phosphorylase [Deltaproteobacteria bacterium]